LGRPYLTFHRLYQEVVALSNFNDNGTASPTRWAIEKQSVITIVTAVEVYFRDMLDCIFRLCKPVAFRPYLKQIHPLKYDIDDLIEFHVSRVHPLELIADNCNFQNPDEIAKVFKALIGRPFWDAVLDLHFRLVEQPSLEVKLDQEYFKSLQRTLKLRHEIIHSPDMDRCELSDSERCDIHSIGLLICGCDILLTDFISKNLDEEIKQKSGGS